LLVDDLIEEEEAKPASMRTRLDSVDGPQADKVRMARENIVGRREIMD